MIRLGDLNPGDIIQFIDPNTNKFGIGTFVKIINRRTGSKRTDIILNNAIGHKITIWEEWIDWNRTAHHKGVA